MKKTMLFITLFTNTYLFSAACDLSLVAANRFLRIVLSESICTRQPFTPEDFAKSLYVQKVNAATTDSDAEYLCKNHDFFIYIIASALKSLEQPTGSSLFLHLTKRPHLKKPFKVIKTFKFTLTEEFLTQAKTFLAHENEVKTSGKPWLLRDIKRVLPDAEILIARGLFIKEQLPIFTPPLTTSHSLASLPPPAYQEDDAPPPYLAIAAAALPPS